MRTCTKETPAARHGLENVERLDLPQSCHATARACQTGSGALFAPLTIGDSETVNP
jgi:hypothetical protein